MAGQYHRGWGLRIHLLGDFRLFYADQPVTGLHQPRLQSFVCLPAPHRHALNSGASGPTQTTNKPKPICANCCTVWQVDDFELH